MMMTMTMTLSHFDSGARNAVDASSPKKAEDVESGAVVEDLANYDYYYYYAEEDDAEDAAGDYFDDDDD